MIKVKIKTLFALSVLLIGNSFATPVSPVGKWKSIDDETKKAKSIIQISESSGVLSGNIVKLFREADEVQNPLCDKCEGSRKDQPIQGMNILWDLKARSDDWGDGHILDPKNGKVYKVKIKVVEDGKKLQVRGFLGISLLGRTQIWEKFEETE